MEGLLQPAHLIVFFAALGLFLGIVYLTVRVIRAAWKGKGQ